MKIANAPCSWGILEFGLDGKTADYQTVLKEMAETGYIGTELGDWGFMPTDPDILKELLACQNLELVGAFVPVDFIDHSEHKKGAKTALKIAKLLGIINPDDAKIVLSDDNGKHPARKKMAGRIQPEHGLTPAEWDRFSAGVEYVAKQIFDTTGVQSVFHHHCAGFVETPEEIEILMDKTDPDIVSLCFDTGHYAFGGGNPVQGIKKFAGRIEHVHFKDWSREISARSVRHQWDYFESVGNGIFCELGEGSVDFRAVSDELESQNYSGWVVVEQDVLPGMGSPKESARKNRDFLKSIGI